MSDLFENNSAPKSGENAPEFSVSDLSGAIKKTVEGAFGRVRVRGEVGRVFRAGSGHLYYDLKDDKSVLACTTWRGQVGSLGLVPEEGIEVIATGKLTTFGAQSKYNLNVDTLEIAGEGALMAMLEKRKKALAAEGLFDLDRKQPIPFLPEVIGVVTSPSGAVIRDILHRLRDRFPRKVLVWPVAVQGEASAPQVAAAIRGFNALSPGGSLPRPDVLIVARGGGSIEDLWGFNEEIVVRAAATSAIPLISAVGHETDTTLIDYASDLRAPTPTAAAEHAVPVRAELSATVAGLEERRRRALGQAIAMKGQRLRDLARALPKPSDLVALQAQRVDMLGQRLPLALQASARAARVRLSERAAGLRPRALQTALARRGDQLQGLTRRLGQVGGTQIARERQRLDALDRMRQSLGYMETLKRGYAVVRDTGGDLIGSAEAAKASGVATLQFHDGDFALDPGPAPKPKPRKSQADDPGQGSLF